MGRGMHSENYFCLCFVMSSSQGVSPKDFPSLPECNAPSSRPWSRSTAQLGKCLSCRWNKKRCFRLEPLQTARWLCLHWKMCPFFFFFQLFCTLANERYWAKTQILKLYVLSISWSKIKCKNEKKIELNLIWPIRICWKTQRRKN